MRGCDEGETTEKTGHIPWVSHLPAAPCLSRYKPNPFAQCSRTKPFRTMLTKQTTSVLCLKPNILSEACDVACVYTRPWGDSELGCEQTPDPGVQRSPVMGSLRWSSLGGSFSGGLNQVCCWLFTKDCRHRGRNAGKNKAQPLL